MTEQKDEGGSEDFLLYDGECPVCSRYVLWTRLREAHPGIRLLNAHERPDLVGHFRARGIEVNDTFVLRLDGCDLVGAAAMAKISGLIPRDGLWQRILAQSTRSRRLLTPVYPVLVRLRKALLRLLGRPQIK
ncbi:MAG: DCC1-like thiol-disulfide oxidoreductase family protein [Pseudomonadota bacterium]